MKICIPCSNKTTTMTGARIKGKGIGAVLLDGGLGGQSSYSSIDDYMATTNARYPKSGAGLAGLDQIRGKMENLMIKPKITKSKNIKFSL